MSPDQFELNAELSGKGRGGGRPVATSGSCCEHHRQISWPSLTSKSARLMSTPLGDLDAAGLHIRSGKRKTLQRKTTHTHLTHSRFCT